MPSTILWADDEIDLLKPHIMFLKGKGYDVVTACSGADALELAGQQNFDLIILDENMPGLTGLETLQRIKLTSPHIPVIMITKSEEENIMDQAVGNKIADYLIKPVNPNQILLSIKKKPPLRPPCLHPDRQRLPPGILADLIDDRLGILDHRLDEPLPPSGPLGDAALGSRHSDGRTA